MSDDRSSSRFMSIYDLVDAAIATDPSALQRALTMMNHHDAANFYREECKKIGVGPVQSFCRQIHANAAFIDFSNNYFGERGIIPVLATLQRLAVVEVRFLKCDLSVDDISRIHAALASHATLTSIDLRGNLISLPSARKLLSLAIQNRRITAINLDDNVPKCVLIQRQCLSNANIAVHSSACVICQKSMVHSVTGNVESKIFVALEERIAERMLSVSIAEVETIFRCLLACADVNDGVLFLCSIDCINSLAAEILEAARMVVNEMTLGMKHTHHRHPILAKCVVELIDSYKMEELPARFFSLPDQNVSASNQDPREQDWNPCTVCGRSCVSLRNGAAHALHMVCKDVRGKSDSVVTTTSPVRHTSHASNPTQSRGKADEILLRPTALLRLIHVVLKYARMDPCSKKCVRHLVRYGIQGYGGVCRSLPDPSDPLLSSLDVPLSIVPDDDFCVVNFAEVQMLDHGEEDTTCAVTVASAMSDIDTIPIDPYCIFAVGRFLAKRSVTVFGMELRHACEAVRVVGCLTVDHAPFQRKSRPSRSAYVDWQKWSLVTDVDKVQRMCFARRRQALYVVDGDLDNNFDRVRVALWAFREQQRCAVVSMKFCLAWLHLDKGIILPSIPPKGGFYTTVKVLGQSMVNNSLHLILQPNFGSAVGNRGFFYCPRSIFNRSIRGPAYMFVDTTAIRENQGVEPPQHYRSMVSPNVLRVLERTSLVYDVVRFLGNSDIKQVGGEHRERLRKCLSTMPPCLFFAFFTTGVRTPTQYETFRRGMLKLFENSFGKTQLAFLWNEVLGDSAAVWIDKAADMLAAMLREKRGAAAGAMIGGGEAASSFREDVEWSAATSPAPSSAFGPHHRVGFDVSPTPSVASLQADVMDHPVTTLHQTPVEKAVPPPPAPATKGPVKKGLIPQPPSTAAAGQAPPSSTAAAPADPMKAQFLQALKAERDEQRLSLQLAKGRSSASWDPHLLGHRTMPLSALRSDDVADDSIPPEVLCARWNAVNVLDEFGQSTEFILCFIKQYACMFNCEEQMVVKPLHTMASDPVYCKFPFSTGFDCAFRLTSRKKPEVYFFAEQTWILWDVCRGFCVTGPHATRIHRSFRALPAVFHQRVDGAVEIPQTNRVVMVAQTSCVVFDVVDGVVLKQLTSIRDADSPLASIATCFPFGPMACVSWSKPKAPGNGSSVFSTSVSQRSPPNAQLLVGYDGMVLWAPATVLATGSGSLEGFKPQSICDTPLNRLPLAFLQQSVKAASSIVESLLSQVPRNKLCNLALFQPHNLDSIPNFKTAETLSCNTSEIIVTSTLSTDVHPPASVSGGADDEMDASSSKAHALMALMLPFENDACTPSQLIQNCVLLRKIPGDSLDDNDDDSGGEENPLVLNPFSSAAHRIDFDLGGINAKPFAYLQLFLDTSCIDARVLQLAPLRVSVQMSCDGVCFMEVAQTVITAAVASAYWTAVHTARYWRLVFVTPIPDGVGVAKVLWYKAQWVVDSSPYELTETFVPSADATVWVNAEKMFRSANNLLVDIAPQPVFTMPKNDTWYPRHCILPMLPRGESALFFCGDAFVEYDFIDEHVVSSRAVAIAIHPSFAGLPMPFLMGFDAIFYPDFRDQAKVVILHDDQVITWDIFEGIPLGPVETLSESAFFKGLPFPVKRLNDVINVWGYPGHVFIFSDAKVLRWNVLEACAVEGPFTREQIPVFDVPAFGQSPFLAVTSFPGEFSKTFFIFCNGDVVESTIQQDHKIVQKSAVAFGAFDFFSTVSRYLSWGEARQSTSISVDFKSKLPLVMGITMRSSDGCNPSTEWTVEYSDDNASWVACAAHSQSVPRSLSCWHLKNVSGQSHRYWRFTSVPDSSQSASLEHIVYSQLLFQVLPQHPLSIMPWRVSFNGTSCAPMSTLLTGTFSFESSMSLGLSSKPLTLVVDFGASTMMELVGLSYDSDIESDPCDVWQVSYSRDGMEWQSAGEWRVTTCTSQLSWAPMYPQRYWKFDLKSSSTPKRFRNFQLFENAAPSIVTNEGSDVRHFVGMLHPKIVSDELIDFRAFVGATLSIDFKQNSIALVGVAMAVEVDSFTFMTSFSVEYSDDSLAWFPVGTLVSCDDMGNAAWASEGAHRYWRLRVAKHYGATTVRMKRLELSVGGALLYQQHQRHLVTSQPCVYSFAGEQQATFVGVSAELPPKSVFVVQCLADDSVAWKTITHLINTKPHRAECRCGWPMSCISSHWRLARLSESNVVVGVESFANAGIQLPVDSPIPTSPDVCSPSNSAARPTFAALASPRGSLSGSLRVDGSNTSTSRFVAPGLPGIAALPSEVSWYSPSSLVHVKAVLLPDVVVINYRGFMTADTLITIGDAVPEGVVGPSCTVLEVPQLKWDSVGKPPTLTWKVGKGRAASFSSVIVRYSLQSPPPALPAANPAPVSLFSPQRSFAPAPATPAPATVSPASTVCVQVQVEISDDGEYFVPVASSELIVDVFGNVSITWHQFIHASHWRLRFCGLPVGGSFDILGVEWFFRSVAPSFPSVDRSIVLSNFQEQISSSCCLDTENDLRVFFTEGLHQLDSVASGLREPDDIDEHALVVQPVVNWQKMFQKHMVRRLKENRDLQQSQLGAAGSGVDISIILQTLSNTQSDPRCTELLQSILNQRIVVHELKLMKDSTSWCGPKLEYRGPLALPLFTLVDIPFSMSFRWALSMDMLRCKATSLTRTAPPLQSAATIALTLNINKSDWFAGVAFPTMPILYEFSITERPTVVVFATGVATFNPPRSFLLPPGGNGVAPIATTFPYAIHRGVNFITTVRLKECMSPAVDLVARIFPGVAAEKSTLIILSQPSLTSRRSIVRFTSSAVRGVNFGIPGLDIPTVSFELSTWEATPSLPLDPALGGPGHPAASGKKRVCTFTSLDASITIHEKKIPLHLAGTMTVTPTTTCVEITAQSASGFLENLLGLSDCVLHNIGFSCELSASSPEAPYTALPAVIEVHGTLNIGNAISIGAKLSLSALLNGLGFLDLSLKDCSFGKLVQIAGFLTNTTSRLNVETWMHEVPLRITATLRSYPKQFSAKATGVVSFYGQGGLIAIFVTVTGVHMSFKVPSLQIGGLAVIGSRATNGLVLVEGAAPVGSVATIRLDGLCKTLSPEPTPSQIELSAAGTLCLSSGDFFDVCVRDESLLPVGAYATVSVTREKFIAPLAQALRSAPLVATLLSHGLPFSFSVHNVCVTNCALARQSVQFTFQGVLFGFRYDVTTTVCAPENSLRAVHEICEGLAAHIIEQCNESLWSSLDTFIGCVHELASDSDEEEENASSARMGSTLSPNAVSTPGLFAKSPRNRKDQAAKRRDKRSASVAFAGEVAAVSSLGPQFQRSGSLAFGGTKVSSAKERQAKVRNGTFLASWIEAECDGVDKMLAVHDPSTQPELLE